jgi:hypothetical protein
MTGRVQARASAGSRLPAGVSTASLSGPGAGVLLGSGSHPPPAGSVRLAGNGQDPSVDGAGAGQLARAGYPLLGRSRAVWHWRFDLVLVVTTSKIAFL